MKIKSLAHISFDKLFDAFQKAFADYEVQFDQKEHWEMLKRRGFDPELSFAAFDGDDMVSFTCNGIGDFYGVPTAYDTGTGTLKDYRGKGLATQVFEYSIPYLKEAGIREYLLEVLQHNQGAVSVYTKIGFEVAGEFYYFRAKNDQVKNSLKKLDFPYVLKSINLNQHNELSTFWDFKPSWQNSFDSVNRSLANFKCTGIFTEDKLIGYTVFEPASGDITQMAVDRQFRRKGVGSLLFQEMIGANKHHSLKIINTDIQCDSVTAFLKSKNIEPTGRQFEMIKSLI